MYKFLRKILFLLDPEIAHNLVLWCASKFKFLYPVAKKLYSPQNCKENFSLNGQKFKNLIGLAAGMDKNGEAILFWNAIGFSHIEVGTVTPKPQKGNPKPRLYRLVEQEALLNRMGFNNKGAEKIKLNIQKAKRKLIDKDFVIGVNIGKNKETPLDKAVDDYLFCFEKLFDVADYFTVNISSPNTAGLRELQNEKHLSDLLKSLQEKNSELAVRKGVSTKDIFIKISPDLNKTEITKIFNIAGKYNITGFIATNTSINHKFSFPISKDGTESADIFKGGISGKPIKELSNKVLGFLNELKQANEYKPVLIASGGVFSKEDFKSKILLGASLVQIYTGFVYEGPLIIKKLLES
ncbi:MAG: quinone-dependent dihydroorotate dehydrogenase [Ignavibacteria bacterium]|nr:quinone-dependent dihydroorotate dehydrogenase [Ignavibacteria bacterium]